MMVLRSSAFMFRRMLRNYVSLCILLLTPIALITVLGFLADDAMNEQLGILIKAEVAVTMIFAFQLFSGFNTMEYVKGDLMSSTKWRMYSLPLKIQQHAASILIACTVFSVLQGYIIVLYTQFMYGIDWGNHVFILLALLAVAFLSQLVFINIVLGVKVYKTAERLGTTFGLVSLLLAEVWFPLPDNVIFNFLSTYGNPLSLVENMVYATMTGENVESAIISIVIIITVSILLVILSSFLGRRRLV
ncbi:ABC transporter permease [Evansella cellulosilytica]|uniref:ABC-2 type transporter n=1 Tax=Evansella cellulosilytica (strain ATCC 21833 / DSM 2522 / FERM P-1141 / JCM 9156 / N-4) TaxID=649639 RepID=E6TSQ2_EVAC2|nr:ABC transporter permease [Evansella cellulosilytica]ADU29560.1 ABC-2 type transporter [Evansella cellulosilytica DSM 2522]